MQSRPFGWAFEDIQRTLGISERTLLRYAATSKKHLVDQWGRPYFQVVVQAGKRKLRLSETPAPIKPIAYQVASLYFMLTVLKCLEDTVLKDGIEGLWDQLYRNMAAGQRLKLGNLETKFYTVPNAPKRYKDFDDRIDLIVRALVQQHRLRIDYGGLLGEGKVHQFDLYTLLEYRGGLYLLGRTHLHSNPIFLALERIKEVELVLGADKRPIKFVYPKSFRPDQCVDGTFGIMDGKELRVELLIANDQTEAYLKARAIHPTQRFIKRRDGKTVMSMVVRGTEELTNWILGFGPWLEVLKPIALRSHVNALLNEAAEHYKRPPAF